MITEACNCEQSLTLEKKTLSLEERLEKAYDILFEKIVELELEIETSDIEPSEKVKLLEVQIHCMKVLKEVYIALSI